METAGSKTRDDLNQPQHITLIGRLVTLIPE